MLPAVTEFVGDLFDRKVAGPQKVLRPIHPEAKQHGLRRNSKNLAETVPQRIMAPVQTEKHWPGRARLEDLSMNFLPQLETLGIDDVTAIDKFGFGSARQPAGHVYQLKSEPGRSRKSVEKTGRAFFERQSLAGVTKSLALTGRKFEDPPLGRSLEEFAEVGLDGGADMKLKRPETGTGAC